jgi:hypothetical protein
MNPEDESKTNIRLINTIEDIYRVRDDIMVELTKNLPSTSPAILRLGILIGWCEAQFKTKNDGL